MSSEAVGWAFKQRNLPSSVKFTLVAMCECAHYETTRIYPSIEHLREITGQNRKTIIANIAVLEREGYITDTGLRCGGTKQIKVYSPAIGTVPKTGLLSDKKPAPKSTKNGTVPKTVQSQKRNSSENGAKESQKRDTEPSREPSRNNPLNPPRTGERKVRVKLDQDWQAPAVAKLSPAASAAAAQWPDGAYAAQAEAFAQYHRGSGHRRADWDELWAAWVIRHHEGVMRAARHGHGVVAPQPAEAGRTVEPKPASAAKAREDGRSADLHDVLREQVGEALWAEWYAPAALLIGEDRLVVAAPSEFHRSWMEDRCGEALRHAADTLGIGFDAIDYQMIAPAKNSKRGRK